ncbi:unnamed protein product [Polarella glacialis]|uniref:Uncharacterized protein n=1 Tax=Polarella glacialis TaxID=89957 RepID=A0A813GWZ7_POLGL|nr:unnamed protein product [Polarella glacialis]
MCKHSATALAFYDEDGDEMREKKERYLNEMQKQVGDVLARATGQAQKLCGMLSAELDEKVKDHVIRMQKILGECDKSNSSEAPAVYENLAKQMVLHLHSLRRPAIEHFQKLISLSGRSQFLEDTLRFRWNLMVSA